MTDYNLTTEDRKKLTEFLGECWHTNYISEEGKCYDCKKKIDFINIFNRRTFTTPDEQHAVFCKLVETKRWNKFKDYFFENVWRFENNVCDYDWDVALFINPKRFCKLVNDYLKEIKC